MSTRSLVSKQSRIICLQYVILKAKMTSTGRLEENGVVTRCEITTFEAGDVFELPYDDDERVQKLILNVTFTFYQDCARIFNDMH